ncbi:metal-dependent hydrolase [Undibacterium sp. TC9W]
MSSLLAHVAAGLTLYFCKRDDQANPAYPGMALAGLLVLLAILPDFDYFAIWFLHLRFEQRYTHSLTFCLLAGGITYYLMYRLYRLLYRPLQPAWTKPGFTTLLQLLLAACSHLLLDILVGRSLPLLWPFLTTEFFLPVAMLPGAAHTGLASFTFWRNLLLESCLLLPVLLGILLLARRLPMRIYLPEILLVLSMWSGLLVVSGALTAS